MSGGDEAINSAVSLLGLWWPDAEEGDIRTAAGAWETLADAIENAHDDGRGGTNQARAHWTGDASEAFGQHWQKFDQAMPPTATGCRQLASALHDYADEVEKAKHQVEELAAEIGVGVAVGVALSFVTFGGSAAADAAAIAAARAAALRIAAALTERVGLIASRAIIGATFSAVSGLAGNAASQALRVEGFHDGDYSLTEFAEAGGTAFVTGGLLGGAGGAWARFRPAKLPGGAPTAAAGTQSLGKLPEGRLVRDSEGLITKVDGRPVNDYVNDVATSRAEQLRSMREAGDVTRKDVGEVSAHALDRRTGEIVEATNGRTAHVIDPHDLHPQLQGPHARIQSNPPHPAPPLQHAEVKAVNHLLQARPGGAGEGALDEMTVGTRFPFGTAGVRDAPFCANCTGILGPVESLSGKLSTFDGAPGGGGH